MLHVDSLMFRGALLRLWPCLSMALVCPVPEKLQEHLINKNPLGNPGSHLEERWNDSVPKVIE